MPATARGLGLALDGGYDVLHRRSHAAEARRPYGDRPAAGKGNATPAPHFISALGAVTTGSRVARRRRRLSAQAYSFSECWRGSRCWRDAIPPGRGNPVPGARSRTRRLSHRSGSRSEEIALQPRGVSCCRIPDEACPAKSLPGPCSWKNVWGHDHFDPQTNSIDVAYLKAAFQDRQRVRASAAAYGARGRIHDPWTVSSSRQAFDS